MPLRLDASAAGFERDFSSFLARNRDTDENVDRIAADIVADVRARRFPGPEHVINVGKEIVDEFLEQLDKEPK